MKIVIITQNIPHYRVPVYEMLSKFYELTIFHNGKQGSSINKGYTEKIITLKKIGPFYYLNTNLHRELKKYDIVISEGNIRHIDRNFLIINPFRKYKWITWGIGVSASYGKKYDTDKKFNKIRNFIFRNADANMFYSEYPVTKYIAAGFKKESLFVANNTIEVNFTNNLTYEKETLLFVGTLYKQKKIFNLISSYSEALSKNANLPNLRIIGEGSEYESINNWIKNSNLEHKIILLGPIYDQIILEAEFRSALACISPGQAGLTVLTSMGYGTAFITKLDAITGGEIFNITNGVNGLLYNDDEELVDILIDISLNKEKYITLGNEARKHYLEHCTPVNMVNGFRNAIDYVNNISNKAYS